MSQITVKHRFIHQAPRKLRLVSDMVRGLPAPKAIAELETVRQDAATAIRKAIISATAAAKDQGLNISSLFVGQIMVDEGPKMKRMIPRSRGQSSRILKRMSHLTVSLTDEAIVIASGKAYKKELAVVPNKKNTAKKAPVTPDQPQAAEAPAEEVVATAEGSK